MQDFTNFFLSDFVTFLLCGFHRTYSGLIFGNTLVTDSPIFQKYIILKLLSFSDYLVIEKNNFY